MLDPVRPVCLGDSFVHGIGGGNYDEVTDDLMRRWLGIEPPGFVVLSATLRLPLDPPAATADDVRRAGRHLRDLAWNPQRYAGPAEMVAAKGRLIREQPIDRRERRAWFRRLQDATLALRPFVADRIAAAEREVEVVRRAAEVRAAWRLREFAWCLFPEEVKGRMAR